MKKKVKTNLASKVPNVRVNLLNHEYYVSIELNQEVRKRGKVFNELEVWD